MARPFARLVSGLALAGLAILLTGVFAWGVIGKCWLDRDARAVYKATRAVCAEMRELPGELPPRVDVPPPRCDDDAGPLVACAALTPPPPDVAAASPSRSPPLS